MDEYKEQIFTAIRDGLAQAVASKLTGYSSPLDGILEGAIKEHGGAISELMAEGIKGAIGDPEFRTLIKDAARARLAKIIVERFGGELEKRVNQLKSDPATRARITLAIDEIIKTSAKA